MPKIKSNILDSFLRSHWAMSRDHLIKYQSVIESWQSGKAPDVDFSQLNNKETNSLQLAVINENGVVEASRHNGDLSIASVKNKSVAIIPIIGPMFKRGNMMQQISGARSMEMIEKDIQQANDNPNIEAIVLKMDTPGGTVAGTESLGRVVKESKKVIVTFAEDLLASAGVWVGSGGMEIVASGKTTFIGSIGVLMTHVDRSGWFQLMGLVVTHITADQSDEKVFAPDNRPLEDEDIARVKELLNADAAAFISVVKSNRKGKINLSEGDPFKGRMYPAKEALKIGLIDHIGDLTFAVKRALKLSKDQRSTSTQQNANFDMKTYKNLNLEAQEFGANETSVTEFIDGNETKAVVNVEDLEKADTNLEKANSEVTRLETKNKDLQTIADENKEAAEKTKDFSKGIISIGEKLDTEKEEREKVESSLNESKKAKEKLEVQVKDLEGSNSKVKAELDKALEVNKKLSNATGSEAITPDNNDNNENGVETDEKKPVTKVQRVYSAVSQADKILENMGLREINKN